MHAGHLRTGILFCFAVLTACSTQGSAIAPQLVSQSVPQNASTLRAFAAGVSAPTVFVAVASTNSVVEFPSGVKNPQPLRRIKDGIYTPISIATDQAGTLYVLNGGRKPATITEYAGGSSSPTATLTLQGLHASGGTLTVGPDGTIYVALSSWNYNGLIAEYYQGSPTPSLEIYAPQQPPAGQGAPFVDGSNNLYTTYYGGSCCGTWMEKYPARSKRGALFSGDPAFAMTIDGSGNFVIYGVHGIRVVSPAGTILARFASPQIGSMSFDKVDNLLYTEDGTVNIIDYGTRTYYGTFRAVHDATSIAVSPNTY